MELREVPLGQTLATIRVCLKSRNTRIYEEDCILGELPLPSGDEVQTPEATI
jgi:hypothetical protein